MTSPTAPPQVLQLAQRDMDPGETMQQIGIPTLMAIAARRGRMIDRGALQLRIGTRSGTYLLVVLAADDTYSLEVGRETLGGRRDGSWNSLRVHHGIHCDQLSAVIIALFLRGEEG